MGGKEERIEGGWEGGKQSRDRRQKRGVVGSQMEREGIVRKVGV